MPYLTEENWNNLPFPDYRARFFVEVWWAYLSKHTPHFYQARLMNPYSLLREVRDLISDYIYDTKNISLLRSSCEELQSAIKEDGVFLELVEYEANLLSDLLNSVIKQETNSPPKEVLLRKLAQLAGRIVTSEERYISTLLDNLYKALTEELGNDEGNGKRRRLESIYSLTVLSGLLNAGFSQTYLYNRAELFTYNTRYKGRSFYEQLQMLFDRLKRPIAEYEVLQAFSISKGIELIGDVGGVSVTKNVPNVLDESDVDKFGLEESSIAGYLSATIEAADYVTAAWKMQRKVEVIKDIVAFEHKQDVLGIAPRCIVVHRGEGATYKHKVPINLLQSLLIKRSDPYQISMVDVLNHAIGMGDQFDRARESITRIVRYYRQGISESTFESRFLSMWIALEVLLESGEGNKIEKIVSFVPELYAFDSLRKRLQYLLDLFRKHKVSIPDDVEKATGFDSASLEVVTGMQFTK